MILFRDIDPDATRAHAEADQQGNVHSPSGPKGLTLVERLERRRAAWKGRRSEQQGG